MSRETRSIIVTPITWATILLSMTQPLMVNAEASNQHHQYEQQLLPSLLVDTKYWAKSTEFGDRNNWRAERKPCTLLERIQVSEKSVVTLGDSLDALGGALESKIKELILPMNGIMLMDKDTYSDYSDSTFVQYLNQSGDCQDHESSGREQVFEFAPHSDLMSWFNPENWESSLNEAEIIDWVPESHRIPCGEDVVVFGTRRNSSFSGSYVDTSQLNEVQSFKVNFMASLEAHDELAKNNISVNNIRVSILKIGNQTYNQQEFDQLINSILYKDTIFDFNSSSDSSGAYSTRPTLSIDESSVQKSTGEYICLDEAGCICGNEELNVMKTICSFHLPIEPDDLPCYDPISATGYCNDICATTMIISMDPMRFSEKFLAHTMNKMLTNDEMSSYFEENIFIGARRTYDSIYEITFRHVTSGSDYEFTLGREREFAELVRQELSHDAIRSFYGIKSMSMKSSVDWRKNNRSLIFWTSFALLIVINAALFSLLKIHKNSDNFAYKRLVQASEWFRSNFHRQATNDRTLSNDTELFVRFGDLSPDDQPENQSIDVPHI